MTKLDTFESSGKAILRSRCPVGPYRSSTGVPSSWDGWEISSRRSHTFFPRGSTSSVVIVVRKEAGTLRAAMAVGQPGDGARSIESSSPVELPLPFVMPHPKSRRMAQERCTAVHLLGARLTVSEDWWMTPPEPGLDRRGRGGVQSDEIEAAGCLIEGRNSSAPLMANAHSLEWPRSPEDSA